jgi:hypothetical protein
VGELRRRGTVGAVGVHQTRPEAVARDVRLRIRRLGLGDRHAGRDVVERERRRSGGRGDAQEGHGGDGARDDEAARVGHPGIVRRRARHRDGDAPVLHPGRRPPCGRSPQPTGSR